MDYESKYNELVEAARAVVEGNPGLCNMNKRLGRVRDLLPEKESADERIRKAISYAICAAVHEDGTLINDVTKDEALAYLEKYKVGCIYPEDNPLTPDECIKPTELCEEHKYIRTLKSLIVDFLRGKDEVDRMYYDKIYDWLERQKEHKPNIGLIQCSWYMEGYHDGKYNNEPKWLIQTGKGGPRYEENPKYETQKPVEWSEEDKEYLAACIDVIDNFYTLSGELKTLTKINVLRKEYAEKLKSWLKSLRPQPHWKPSEEQMKALEHCVNGWQDTADGTLESLYNDLKKLI